MDAEAEVPAWEDPKHANVGSDDNEVRRLAEAATSADFLSAWIEGNFLTSESQRRVQNYYAGFGIVGSRRMGHWYREQLRESEDLIALRPGLRVLEIGAGCGTESLWFARLGASVVGLDSSPSFTPVARERLDILERALGRRLDCRFLCRPILKYQDSSGFDLIWMEMAYHHLEPRREVVAHVSRLLKPGGRVIIVEVNGLNPLLQLMFFKQRGTRTIVSRHDAEGAEYSVGNERITTAASIARAFQAEGIRRQSTRYFRIFPSGKRFERLLALERVLPSAWPLPCFTHFVYVGRKEP